MRLKRKFFARPAEVVAQELLGKMLVRKFPDGSVKNGIITETEAYVGIMDMASHAAGGRKTPRNEVMYGPAGFAYVYFTYGKHWLLNVVTGETGDPQAVLIRGIKQTSKQIDKETNGPAKLTEFLSVDGRFNKEDLVMSQILWVEDRGIKTKDDEIEAIPRVGVPYAGEWKDKPLRFVWKQNNEN